MGLMSVVILTGGTLFVTVSDHVPTLRVEQSCRAAAAVQMAESQSQDGCLKDEMAARAELTKSWGTFRAAERGRCTAEASSDGIDSYVDLLVCLQMSHDVDALNRTSLKGARRK